MEALHDVVKAGKARYIGASSMCAWQFSKALYTAELNGWTQFVSMQNHYNLLNREEEREMMPLCADQGVGVIPWSPLARGKLTRDWDDTTERSETDEFGKSLYDPDQRPRDRRAGRRGRRRARRAHARRSRWRGCSRSRSSPRRSSARPSRTTSTTPSPRSSSAQRRRDRPPRGALHPAPGRRLRLKITLLGTGGPLPDAHRAGPATLVQTGTANILVDVGRGVLMRLTAAGVGLPMLSGVLLTHLHSDHITDLNDVITGHWLFTQGNGELTIFGPPGTSQVVGAIASMLTLDVGYRIDHHDDLHDGPNVTVVEVTPGSTFELGGLTVTVGETNHRPVHPTVGYRLDDGEKTVVLGGDGIPAETLDALCAGADGYVQTVLRREVIEAIPVHMLQDVLDYHSSVEDAAQTASRAGVGTLILTHYIPGMQPGTEDEWRAARRAALLRPDRAGRRPHGDRPVAPNRCTPVRCLFTSTKQSHDNSGIFSVR